jgi:hypothetical protein
MTIDIRSKICTWGCVSPHLGGFVGIGCCVHSEYYLHILYLIDIGVQVDSRPMHFPCYLLQKKIRMLLV